jgi:hypothetical protein
MNLKLIMVLLICAMVPAFGAGNPASAQTVIPPGWSPLSPPPPPPPPPPKIEVPVVPKMDEMPRQAQPSPRPSFSDRITSCLQDGAAAGLGPNDRAAYSRSCANQ